MNEKMITLGNRKYRVGFEEGQEQELNAAVQLFDEELIKLTASGTGMRESQHLMLGGLMLAYRFADKEAGQSEAKAQVINMESELARTKDQVTSLIASEKDLQNRIKNLGDEKTRLSQQIEQTKSLESENTSLKSEIENLKNNTGQQPDIDHEQLLNELADMRTQLNALKSVEAELASVKKENETLKSSNNSDKPQSAEDGIAAALGEIVSGLEDLSK